MRARLSRWLRPPAGDDGYTLMEVIVGATVMALVTGIATSGFISMYQTTARTEAASQAQTALLAAFHRLDREVRYAERIRLEPRTDRDPYTVTYLLPEGDGGRQCVELTLPAGGGDLMRRTWARPTGGPVAPTGVFSAVAPDLIPIGGQNPFTVTAADPTGGGPELDTLRIRLNSTSGSGDKNAVRTVDFSFTALNTDLVRSDDELSCLPKS